jgi:hypothetical protein
MRKSAANFLSIIDSMVGAGPAELDAAVDELRRPVSLAGDGLSGPVGPG